jgi:hypothetical protein
MKQFNNPNNMIAKFRVWNQHGKRWRENVTLHQDGTFWNGGICLGDTKEYSKNIQFSTGLEAKNGQTIFDGDIVEYSLGKHYFQEVVVWNYQGYRLETLNKQSCCPLVKGLEYNIIGNIFENPELLK